MPHTFTITTEDPFTSGWLTAALGLPRPEGMGAEFDQGYDLADSETDETALAGLGDQIREGNVTAAGPE